MSLPRAVLIGGNHLANLLIDYGLPIEDKDASYSEVLKRREQPYADIWVCWAAIMNHQD